MSLIDYQTGAEKSRYYEIYKQLSLFAATDSPLCFRPLAPALRSRLFFAWKKYAVFSPAAEVLLEEMSGGRSAS